MPAQQTFTLGTAVKITTVLSVANPSSVKITIEDMGDTVMVNAVAMTQDTTTVYSYIYQSATTDDEGEYEVIIDAVYGAYTAKSKTTFEMVE